MRVFPAMGLLAIFGTAGVFAQTNCSNTVPNTNAVFLAARSLESSNEDAKASLDRMIKTYSFAGKEQKEKIEGQLFSAYFDQQTNANFITLQIRMSQPLDRQSPAFFASSLIRLNPKSTRLLEIISSARESDLKDICEAMKFLAKEDSTFKLPDFLAIKMLERLEALSSGNFAGQMRQWLSDRGKVGKDISDGMSKHLRVHDPVYISDFDVEPILEVPTLGDRAAVIRHSLVSRAKGLRQAGIRFAAELGPEGEPYLLRAIKDKDPQTAEAIAQAEHLSPKLWQEFRSLADEAMSREFLGWLPSQSVSRERIERLKSYLADQRFRGIAVHSLLEWRNQLSVENAELNVLIKEVLSSNDLKIQEGFINFFSFISMSDFEKILSWLPENPRRSALQTLFQWCRVWQSHESEVISRPGFNETIFGVAPIDQRLTGYVGNQRPYDAFKVLGNLTYSSDPAIKSETIRVMRDLKVLEEEHSVSDEELIRKLQIIVFGLKPSPDESPRLQDYYQRMKKEHPFKFDDDR